jgi:nucleoprotein TPR
MESERLHNLLLEKQVDVEMYQKELETQKVEIENLNQKVYEVHFI